MLPQESTLDPETPFAIKRQLRALCEGKRTVVLITPGEDISFIPKGCDAIRTDRGVFIYNRSTFSMDAVQRASEMNAHGALLGHVEPRSEKCEVVVGAFSEGKEIQASYVSLENAECQSFVFSEMYPEAEILIGGAELEAKILNERAAIH